MDLGRPWIRSRSLTDFCRLYVLVFAVEFYPDWWDLTLVL